MRKTLPFLLFVAAFFCARTAVGQGCSDAGVCTAGPVGELRLGPDSLATADSTRHFARMTFSYAVGEQSTTILMAIAELSYGLTDRLSAGLRLPYQSTEGNLGSHAAIGDPVITLSYLAWKRDPSLHDGRKMHWRGARRLDVMLGMKLPANAADATVNDRPLPMPSSTQFGHDRPAVGRELPLPSLQHSTGLPTAAGPGQREPVHPCGMAVGACGQGLFRERLPRACAGCRAEVPNIACPSASSPCSPASSPSNTWARGYPFGSYARPTGMPVMPTRAKVEGSEGLTLNLTLDAAYALSDHWQIDSLAFGSPLITREERPDGLTRSMVLNTGLRYSF